MERIIREPVNAITHFFAALASIYGLYLLLEVSINSFSIINIISAVVFSIGLIGLYSASTIYHSWNGSEAQVIFLKKIDHMFIYILIAGSYTPICLISLKGPMGYWLISIIWTMALAGIFIKKIWFHAPRWISTAFYLILGWAAIFVIFPLSKVLPLSGMILLFSGGISYSIGAIFYGFKSKKIKLWILGYHEIFHIFTMLGSLCHFIMIYKYVIG